MIKTYENFITDLFRKKKNVIPDTTISSIINDYKDREVDFDIIQTDVVGTQDDWYLELIFSNGDGTLRKTCIHHPYSGSYYIYALKIGHMNYNGDVQLIKKLYSIISTLKYNSGAFIEILQECIDDKIDQSRIDEFEVIKDNKIDWISVSSLIDYYEVVELAINIDYIKKRISESFDKMPDWKLI